MFASRVLRAVVLACSPLLLLACGKLEGEVQDSASAGVAPGVPTGTMVVRLAVSGTNLNDDIEEDVSAVNVTVSEVTIFPDEDSSPLPSVGSLGPVPMLGGPAGFNLLALRGNPVTLASGPIPAADYQRLRVVVSAASVTLNNGQTNALEVDNGAVERGLGLTLDQGETETITVTINIRESLRLNRNNRGSFRPSINVSD